MSDAENQDEQQQQQENQQQQNDIAQLRAENDALRQMLGDHKAQLEKRDGLVKKLRKTEAQAGKFDAIIADVMGVMREGVSEGFLNVISDLSVEKQYSLLKEYRPVSAETKPDADMFHVKHPDVKQPTGDARPKVDPLDSAYDREKKQLQDSGQWNPSTAKALAAKHSAALKSIRG